MNTEVENVSPSTGDSSTAVTIANMSAGILTALVTSSRIATADDAVTVFEKLFDTVSAKISGSAPAPTAEKQVPAVNPKKSIHDDYLICLEDGKKFKSLKRHLMTHYGLSPDAYRQKWGLASDYPMVAPNYAAARSDLAKKMGLGKKR